MDEPKATGRPAKGKDKRDHRVAVYLTTDELAMVNHEAEASGHTPAVVVRMRALESIRRGRSFDDTA